MATKYVTEFTVQSTKRPQDTTAEEPDGGNLHVRIRRGPGRGNQPGLLNRIKKVTDSENGPRHVTPAGRSVFYDLFPAEKAAEMEMRAQLLIGLEHWLDMSRMTQAEAAKVLGVTQARVSDLKRGKIDRFSMDLLVRLAARAGLKPKLKLAA